MIVATRSIVVTTNVSRTRPRTNRVGLPCASEKGPLGPYQVGIVSIGWAELCVSEDRREVGVWNATVHRATLAESWCIDTCKTQGSGPSWFRHELCIFDTIVFQPSRQQDECNNENENAQHSI